MAPWERQPESIPIFYHEDWVNTEGEEVPDLDAKPLSELEATPDGEPISMRSSSDYDRNHLLGVPLVTCVVVGVVEPTGR